MSNSPVPPRGDTPSTKLSEAVVAAVADREGVDPIDLDRPLYDAIDPDALDDLFENSAVRVQFDYLGYTVSIGQGGTVCVTETEDA